MLTCSGPRLSTLAAGISASGIGSLRSATRAGAPRSRERRILSKQLVRRKTEHSVAAADSTDALDPEGVGEEVSPGEGGSPEGATAAATGPAYRTRGGTHIGTVKPGRRIEWLEYQSMLRERAGLLRRSQQQQQGQTFGDDRAGLRQVGVDISKAGTCSTWQSSKPITDATATASASLKPVCSSSPHAAQSLDLERLVANRRGRGGVIGNGRTVSTSSGDPAAWSSSKGETWEGRAAAAASERGLFGGKPREKSGVKDCQANLGTQKLQHLSDETPPDLVQDGHGLLEEDVRVLGHHPRSWRGSRRNMEGASMSDRAGSAANFHSEAQTHFDNRSKGGDAGVRGSQGFAAESEGSSTVFYDRDGKGGGDEEDGEGDAAFAEEPAASRLEELFGKPAPATRRGAAAIGPAREAFLTSPDVFEQGEFREPGGSRARSDKRESYRRSGGFGDEGKGEGSFLQSVDDAQAPAPLAGGDRPGRVTTGDGGGKPSPKRLRRGTQRAGSGKGMEGDVEGIASHSALQGSAWKNVHARGKLKALLAGLSGDYGVHEMVGEHHIHEHIRSKLLETFQQQVLDNPDAIFTGEAGQEAQGAISKLCYHGNFQANAVIKKRPIMARGTFGRTYTFPVGKENRAGKFADARAELVEGVFVPRLVELAREWFPAELENTRRMAEIVDLRNPQQWYPLARLRKRRIIYHGGPTNSGKTYQAIERLKKAGANRRPGDGPAGIFCGPLRLLALEVYEQPGVYCSLMTGQEKREVPFATHVSCTIEMASTTNEYEVAVIDEIQMLADEQRGPSWTAAVLGLNCPEIHVCGGMEGAVLVEALAKEMGDDFELNEYQRKTKLVCAEESLHNNYKNVEPGDAVVAFSRKDIFSIKREIESKTPHKCCIIYGSLPQETRAHQARLFNTEGSGYDVLVASDAIGMGLNLNIRRVIFHSVTKRANAGRGTIKLPPTMLKQIGGRAGRHGKGWEFGEVACLKEADMSYMNHVMGTPIGPIPRAGIFPSVERMQQFSDCLDKTEPESKERRRLAETFAAFAERAKVGDRYFLGTHDQHQALANSLHPVENLTLKERYAISMAPVNSKNVLLVRAIVLFAKAHAAGLPVFINMQLPQKGVLPKSMQEFQTLCSKHNVLDLYRWMSVRFPMIECFAEKSVADLQREELESIITSALKSNISVVGPSEVTSHQSFDPRVLRELKSPDGSSGGGGFGGRSVRAAGEDDEFEQGEDDAYTLP